MVGKCLYGMCRTWAVGPVFYIYTGFKERKFEFIKGEFENECQPSAHASRDFCSKCGISLY